MKCPSNRGSVHGDFEFSCGSFKNDHPIGKQHQQDLNKGKKYAEEFGNRIQGLSCEGIFIRLGQAERNWQVKSDEVLRRFRATSSNSDPCMYYLGQGQEALFIAIYVDERNIFWQLTSHEKATQPPYIREDTLRNYWIDFE